MVTCCSLAVGSNQWESEGPRTVPECHRAQVEWNEDRGTSAGICGGVSANRVHVINPGDRLDYTVTFHLYRQPTDDDHLCRGFVSRIHC